MVIYVEDLGNIVIYVEIYVEDPGKVSTFASLSQKNGFVFVNQFSHFKALSHYFKLYKIRFRLLTAFKTIF